jgi:hypothetical protein
LHSCSLVLFLFNVLTHYTHIWNNNIQHNSFEWYSTNKKCWKHKGAYKMISRNFLISNTVSWQLVLMDMVHSSTTVIICKQWQIRFIMHDYKMKWKCYGRKQNKTCSSTLLLSSPIQHRLIIIKHSNCFYKIPLSKSHQISA